MQKIPIDRATTQPIYLQIANYISKEIENGHYPKNMRMLSINEFSAQHKVARDTVERSYRQLIQQGYIISSVGKGYFVNSEKQEKLKVLFIMNKLSSYKKIIYYSFLEALGAKAKVNLQVHHYDPALLDDILDSYLGQYHYYVVMPHFFTGTDPHTYQKILTRIPAEQLLLLDKQLSEFGTVMSVFQDFERDIYEALQSAASTLQKYKAVVVIFPPNSNHPPEILKGVKRFCKETKIRFSIEEDTASIKIQKETAYIFITEDDLGAFIKAARQTIYQPGKDIGILSFNDTVFKELLDITVITTDFEEMGRTAATLILENQPEQVRNRFKYIKRSSL